MGRRFDRLSLRSCDRRLADIAPDVSLRRISNRKRIKVGNIHESLDQPCLRSGATLCYQPLMLQVPHTHIRQAVRVHLPVSVFPITSIHSSDDGKRRL